MPNPNVTIILAFRNREMHRVQRCLESLVPKPDAPVFPVLLIDYGSDTQVVQDLRKLVAGFSFVTLVEVNAQGWVWNRARALNTGVLTCQTEYVLFGDIDLVYSPGFVEAILPCASPTRQVFASVSFLPEGFSSWVELDGQPNGFPSSGQAGRGGVHLVGRQALLEIGCYDEFYCFWGMEDTDLFRRLTRHGLEESWFSLPGYYAYHQWHPTASVTKPGFFPDRWWDQLLFHHVLVERGVITVGLKTAPMVENRSLIDAPSPSPVLVEARQYQNKELLIIRILEVLTAASGSRKVQLRCGPPNPMTLGQRIRRSLARWLVERLQPGVDSLWYLRSQSPGEFVPELDLPYLIWEIVRLEDVVADYRWTGSVLGGDLNVVLVGHPAGKSGGEV